MHLLIIIIAPAIRQWLARASPWGPQQSDIRAHPLQPDDRERRHNSIYLRSDGAL